MTWKNYIHLEMRPLTNLYMEIAGSVRDMKDEV